VCGGLSPSLKPESDSWGARSVAQAGLSQTGVYRLPLGGQVVSRPSRPWMAQPSQWDSLTFSTAETAVAPPVHCPRRRVRQCRAGACWTGSNGLWVHGLGRQGEFATEAKERGELAPNCLGQLGP
jgi:hypothetical protein